MPYKITNETRKQRPTCVREKVGFMLQLTPNGSLKGPGMSETVDELTEAHLNMRKVGHVSITEVKDKRATLKEIEDQVEIERRMADERRQRDLAEARKAKVTKTGFESSPEPVPPVRGDLDKAAMKEAKRIEDGMATSTPVAQNEVPQNPQRAEVADDDLDADAINPDGEPNFAVRAQSHDPAVAPTPPPAASRARGRGRASTPSTPV